MGTQYCFCYNLRHFHTQAMHIVSSVRVHHHVVVILSSNRNFIASCVLGESSLSSYHGRRGAQLLLGWPAHNVDGLRYEAQVSHMEWLRTKVEREVLGSRLRYLQSCEHITMVVCLLCSSTHRPLLLVADFQAKCLWMFIIYQHLIVE